MGNTQAKNKSENKELSSRLMAVQACYQLTQNAKPMRTLIDEFLQNPPCIDIDGEPIAKPHGILFKRILSSVDDRKAEVEEIIKAQIPAKTIIPKAEDKGENDGGNDGEPVTPTPAVKDIEPLLKSVLICGIAEILVHDDIDAALIIDDYLNITHAYYEKQQVSLVNGVLDKLSKLIRA